MSPGDGPDTAARKPGKSWRHKIIGIMGIVAASCFIVAAFVVVDMRTKSYWTEHECKDHGVCPPTETPGEARDGPREAMGKIRLPPAR